MMQAFASSARACLLLLSLVFFFGSTVTLQATSPPQPGVNDRCAVCGMTVTPYPNWLAAIVFKDGSKAFFDGPKDMFVYFFDLGRYRAGAGAQDIDDMFVSEYYTTRRMSVREVYFVSGSNVMGPMGGEMVPVAGRENAETFLRDHGGHKLMQFDGEKLAEVAASK